MREAKILIGNTTKMPLTRFLLKRSHESMEPHPHPPPEIQQATERNSTIKPRELSATVKAQATRVTSEARKKASLSGRRPYATALKHRQPSPPQANTAAVKAATPTFGHARSPIAPFGRTQPPNTKTEHRASITFEANREAGLHDREPRAPL